MYILLAHHNLTTLTNVTIIVISSFIIISLYSHPPSLSKIMPPHAQYIKQVPYMHACFLGLYPGLYLTHVGRSQPLHVLLTLTLHIVLSGTTPNQQLDKHHVHQITKKVIVKIIVLVIILLIL